MVLTDSRPFSHYPIIIKTLLNYSIFIRVHLGVPTKQTYLVVFKLCDNVVLILYFIRKCKNLNLRLMLYTYT